MSGGIAYVYKLSESKVNREALQQGEITLNQLEPQDKQELRQLLEEHHHETASPLAGMILDNFESEASNFVKVLPRDFARVMEIQQQARELGYEPEGQEVWTKILEVTGG
jgi:glutamate synthase (NADPH/NADH) large chain